MSIYNQIIYPRAYKTLLYVSVILPLAICLVLLVNASISLMVSRMGIQTSQNVPVQNVSSAIPQKARKVPGRKWALLIGVSIYEEYRRLRGASEDATKIFATLKNLGFREDDIILVATGAPLKPNKVQIEEQFQKIQAFVQPEDLVLVYFSGHGRSSGDTSYLMPTDSRRNAFEATSIPSNTITDGLAKLRAKAVIAVYDMCRDGRDKGEETEVATAQLLNDLRMRRWSNDIGPEMRVTIFSCSPGQSSYESNDQDRSTFSYFFERGIKGDADGQGNGARDGYVDMLELKKYLIKNVFAVVNIEKKERQLPDVSLAGNGVEDLTLQEVPFFNNSRMQVPNSQASSVRTPTPAKRPIPIRPSSNLAQAESKRPLINVSDLVVKQHSVIPYVVGGYKPVWWDQESYGEYKEDGRPSGRPVITMTRTDFYMTDSLGVKRHIGKGMFYEGMSPDGKTIYGSKARKGLFAMDLFGRHLRQVTKAPVGNCSFLSDGEHVIVSSGWRYDSLRDQWGTLNLRRSKDNESSIWTEDGLKNQYVLNVRSGKMKLLAQLSPEYGVREVTSGANIQVVDYARKRVFLAQPSGDKAREVAKIFRYGGHLFMAGLTQYEVNSAQNVASSAFEIAPSGNWVSEVSYDYGLSQNKTVIRSLTSGRTLQMPGWLSWWKSGGDKVVFSQHDSKNQQRWYTGSMQSLSRAKPLPVAWTFCTPSPDGKKIAFIERGRLGISDADNFNRSHLSNLLVEDTSPVWTMKGRAVTCVRDGGDYPLDEIVSIGS